MNRRRFFHWCSILLSGAATLFVAIPGIGFLIDPLAQTRGKRRRHRLTKLDDLTIGVPLKFAITEQRVDAWTRYPRGTVGAVWLVRGEGTTVDAFTATCPHLGCRVDHLPADKQFFCPCHKGSFALDGSIIDGPQKRGLDRLDVSIEKVGGNDWVSVVFDRFEPDVPESKPVV